MAKLKLTDKTWELGAALGSGGFGRVVKANSDGITAAIKFVPKAPGTEREMLFADLVGVRNVVPIIDSGETATEWVLVMPLASSTLSEHLDAGPLETDEVITILRDVMAALTDLDGRVVHRDIKPENILLLDGAWCLADFGISRYAEATTAPDTQKFALTPAYAAPERWRSERATAAADIYSVGIMAYEMLAGSRPFRGPALEDFRHQQLHDDPARLTNVGSAFSALVDECLYKAAGARPTAANVAARLERLASLPSSPGLANLRDANNAEVGRQAEQSRQASIAQTETERRADLLMAARRSFEQIAVGLGGSITDAASAARIARGRGSAWTIELGSASLVLTDPSATGAEPWHWEAPAFEVVAHASLTLKIPQNYYGYTGRAHSLWFCDPLEAGAFAWFEVAFMTSPLIGRSSTTDPFALDPGEAAAKALWNGMAEYQAAWPFTPLVIGELDEFIDRWAAWLAQASTGGLQHPSTMPERPSNNWRRS